MQSDHTFSVLLVPTNLGSGSQELPEVKPCMCTGPTCHLRGADGKRLTFSTGRPQVLRAFSVNAKPSDCAVQGEHEIHIMGAPQQQVSLCLQGTPSLSGDISGCATGTECVGARPQRVALPAGWPPAEKPAAQQRLCPRWQGTASSGEPHQQNANEKPTQST